MHIPSQIAPTTGWALSATPQPNDIASIPLFFISSFWESDNPFQTSPTCPIIHSTLNPQLSTTLAIWAKKSVMASCKIKSSSAFFSMLLQEIMNS